MTQWYVRTICKESTLGGMHHSGPSSCSPDEVDSHVASSGASGGSHTRPFAPIERSSTSFSHWPNWPTPSYSRASLSTGQTRPF